MQQRTASTAPSPWLTRRTRRRVAAALAALTTVVVGTVVGIADPASAITTVTTSGTTVTVTVTGSANIAIGCSGGNTLVLGQTGSPAVPCASLTKITVNADSGGQTLDGASLESAVFAAKPSLVASMGDGADTVTETTRSDSIDLGLGKDNFYLVRGVANTLLDLGGDTDTARFFGTNADEELTASSNNANLVVTHSLGGALRTTTIKNGENFEVSAYDGVNVVDLSGIVASSTVDKGAIYTGAGDDTIRGPQAPAFLSAGGGTNQIFGGSASDIISSEGNGDAIDAGGGGDMIFDRKSPQSGRTISNTNGANRYSLEVGYGDAQARIRPAAASGTTITNSLTRPGQQPLSSNIGTVQVDLGTASAAGQDGHGLVDLVALSNDRIAYLSGDASDNDLLDVTIPTGSWSTTGTAASTLFITPTAPGYKPIQASDFGDHKIHGPWTNKDAGFVHRATRDLAYRFATNATISNTALALAEGATTRATVVDGLMATDEYRGLDVDRTFVKYLRRAADPGGRTYWIGSIANGKALWRFRAQLFGSNEYFNKAGGTNSAYVVQAYKDVLGRKPDPSGQAYWTTKLDNGADRGSVALQFINSPETRRRVVDDQFLRFLGRKPTTGEQTTWVDALPTATGEQDLISYLAGSDGYYNAS